MNANLPALRATQGSSLLLYESEIGAVRASLRYKRIVGSRIVFALDVVNATPEPLLATIYALARNGQEIPLPPFSFWIDARSEGYLDLPLSWAIAFTSVAISVRLQGRNVHQRLEASMPRPASAAWFLGGAAAVALIAGAIALAHPQVGRLDVPATALSGTPMNVGYESRGVGATAWELDDLSGSRIESGNATPGNGSIKIDVPRVGTQSVYTVRIATSGPFGSASAQKPVVVVTPRPAVVPPRIISFTLDRAAVPDGTSVVARYRVNADSGDLLAVDAQGTIWAQTAIHGNGVTELSLPRFNQNKELQIRLVVRRGTQLAAAGVGLQTIAH